MATLARSTFNQQLQGRSLSVATAAAHDAELGVAAQKADLNGDGVIKGAEADQLFLEIDRFDNNGTYSSVTSATAAGPTKAGRLAADAVRLSLVDAQHPGPVTGGSVVDASIPWTPNAAALSAARGSGPGKRVFDRAPLYADIYRAAAKHTGVPAEMLLALHANESAMGSWRASTHGPESGFGLDDRWVKTSWGNQKLGALGLGTWERGTDTPKSRLQSAVVAAEHLKRQAAYAGIDIGPNMTTGEVAGAITSYAQGIRAAKRAKASGKSFMFDLGDQNPHPLHPGGTSRTSRGTVRVRPSRKPGLLRWDTLMVLAKEALATPGPVS